MRTRYVQTEAGTFRITDRPKQVSLKQRFPWLFWTRAEAPLAAKRRQVARKNVESANEQGKILQPVND